MNILFILPQIPYPPHSGGRIVTWNTIQRFGKLCRVWVVCLYHHPSELNYLEEVKQVCEEAAAFPAHGKWSVQPLIRSLFSFWPYKAHRFYNPAMAEYIQRLLTRQSFDLIHAQNFYCAPYITGVEPCYKILYQENIEGNLLLRYSSVSRNPLIKGAAWLEGMRTRKHEIRVSRLYDRVLTISPIDRDQLLTYDPALPVQYQRAGVDLETYPFRGELNAPPAVLFTGTLSYYPNVIGVLEFLQNSWPTIRRSIPAMECWIVGDQPPEKIRAFDGHDGIHITGRVPSVDEYLRKALIYIVPLTVGGGIRLKILEAMASGRAIVSTPIGCEGLEGKHDEHLMIADLPDDFAKSVIELARDAEKRNRLRTNARQLVEANYDWDRIIPRQFAMYCSECSLIPPKGSAWV